MPRAELAFAVNVMLAEDAKLFPFVGLVSQKACHIVHMHPLHNHDDRTCALVVES